MADEKGQESTITTDVADEKPAVPESKVEEDKAENKQETTGNDEVRSKEEVKEKEGAKQEEKETKTTESDESSDEEMLGLFDKDVLMEGKRLRKSVPRLSSETITTPHSKRNSDLDYDLGKGSKLGYIPWTEYEINRTGSDELKPLHRLLYGRDGKSREVKKNLRNFCGYPFSKNDPHFKRKEDSLDRFTVNGMRRLCEIFNLKKGPRDEMMSQILLFLLKPTDSGKKAPTPEERKRKRTSKKPLKADKKSNESTPKSKEEISDDEDDKMESKEVDKADAKKPKSPKKSKKEKTTPKKTPKSKESKSPKKTKNPSKEKKPTKVKLPSKASKAKKQEVSDDEDDEPLIKKAKSGSEPTNDDIKKRIHGILDGADLESITMKIVCKQVAESFPNHDLSSRKKFIKETVKEIIS